MNLTSLLHPKFAVAALLAIGTIALPPSSAQAKTYPVPSVYPLPTCWYLNFKHGIPKRIVVSVPGEKVPGAYWYLTYTVTNNTGKEQDYYPSFEMVSEDGKIHPSDHAIPLAVFNAIKKSEGNDLLVSANQIGGPIHQGEDQAKDGVAIWEEPMARMGNFSIYASGLNSESVVATDDAGAPLKNDKGEEMKLWKTLEMDFVIWGDEVKPGNDIVHAKPDKWIMR
ncbi:MAG TPA: hypothetical protein VFE47_16640 [Tepidisphaeraceae bacterium]|jgi:hypothetical protein|nr:hypothetical protein [Tepidisphaeraceae bacterium]